MNPKKIFIAMAVLVFSLFLLPPVSGAAAKLAEITAFKGEVVVLTGTQAARVKKTGHPLNEGDRVQTKEGDAEVTFEDGAILQISPYSSSMIQQKEEEKGFWIFKTKETVRRITCYIGKLRVRSGDNLKQKYMQTPTATAGVRGSDV